MAKSYLRFAEAGWSPSGKTRRWWVSSHRGAALGVIMWYSSWRRYVYETPWQDAVLGAACLREIADFCEARTQEHKQARRP